MMSSRILWILLSVCGLSQCSANKETKKVVEWWDSSHSMVKQEYYVLQDDPKTMQGPYKRYDSAGRLSFETNNVNGRIEGQFTEYYHTGRIAQQGFATGGKYHGIWKLFYPNGQLFLARESRDDRLWEIIGVYDSNGVELDHGDFREGNGTVKEYWFPEGLLQMEGKYIDGLKEGDWKSYYADGLPAMTVKYSKGYRLASNGTPIEREY